MNFDCIILTAGKDCLLIRKVLFLILDNLCPQKVYIITRRSYFVYFAHLPKAISNKVVLIDENTLITDTTFDKVQKWLSECNYSYENTGWYFQQFLKMGFSLSMYAKKEYYLIWDADTIPLKKINFFNRMDLPFFTMKEEYHDSYFLTIENLLGIGKLTPMSFISENMMINVDIMRELISKIESANVVGQNWCQKIIQAMPNQGNAFSEFETYGTYVMHKGSSMYAFRTLNTFRDAGYVYSRIYSARKLQNAFLEYDTVSLEYRDNPKGLIGFLSFVQKGMIFLCNYFLDWWYK